MIDGPNTATQPKSEERVRAEEEAAEARARRARAARAGRAPKVGQRGVQLTTRETEAFKTLFFVDWLDADGLRRLHYPTTSKQRALNRLASVYADRSAHLVRATLPVLGTARTKDGPRPHHYRRTFYALSKKARASVGRRLEREGLDLDTLFASSRPLGPDNPELAGVDEPDPERADHFKKVSDLYVEVFARLHAQIGPPGPDTWFWRNERRAYRPYTVGTEPFFYRPDAELVVAMPKRADAAGKAYTPHAHLLIELQTESSHRGPDEIADKVKGFYHAFPGGRDRARSTPIGGAPAEGTEHHRGLYWAAETEAHMEAAFRAGEALGIPNHAADTFANAADALVEDALSPGSLLWPSEA